MRELAPACPPVDTASSDTVLSPSDAPYTAAASPAGTASHDHEIEHVVRHRLEREPEMLGELAGCRVAQHPGRGDHHWRVAWPEPHVREQHVDIALALDVDPRVGETRPSRERPQRHRLARVAGADDPHCPRALSRAQDLPAGDEGRKDRVGEIRLAAHDATELVDRESPGRDRADGPGQ